MQVKESERERERGTSKGSGSWQECGCPNIAPDPSDYYLKALHYKNYYTNFYHNHDDYYDYYYYSEGVFIFISMPHSPPETIETRNSCRRPLTSNLNLLLELLRNGRQSWFKLMNIDRFQESPLWIPGRSCKEDGGVEGKWYAVKDEICIQIKCNLLSMPGSWLEI